MAIASFASYALACVARLISDTFLHPQPSCPTPTSFLKKKSKHNTVQKATCVQTLFLSPAKSSRYNTVLDWNMHRASHLASNVHAPPSARATQSLALPSVHSSSVSGPIPLVPSSKTPLRTSTRKRRASWRPEKKLNSSRDSGSHRASSASQILTLVAKLRPQRRRRRMWRA